MRDPMNNTYDDINSLWKTIHLSIMPEAFRAMKAQIYDWVLHKISAKDYYDLLKGKIKRKQDGTTGRISPLLPGPNIQVILTPTGRYHEPFTTMRIGSICICAGRLPRRTADFLTMTLSRPISN